MTRSTQWAPGPKTDLIIWDKFLFNADFTNDLIIDESIDPRIRRSAIQIIHNNWDSFCAQGAAQPLFDFEFCLDTGDLKSVCYRKLVYGINERKIMNTHIQILEEND